MVPRQAQPKQLIEGDRRRVKITQAEIDKAKPKQSGRCLVAKAIAAKFGDASRIDVDMQTIRFTRNGERWVYLTPWAVQRYIVEFDAGDPIDPFEFSLTQSVQIQRRARTDAGLRTKRTENKASRARQKLEVTQTALEPGRRPSATQRIKLAQLQVEAEAAAAEHEAAKADVRASGQPQQPANRTDVPQRSAMSEAGIRGTRSSKRHYGARDMRVNQDRAERKTLAVEAEAGLHLPAMPKGGYPAAAGK